MPVTSADTKPYDFVPLDPAGKRAGAIRGHEQWRDLNGSLSCTLTALTPLHVGSGLVVPVEELKEYDDINWPAGFNEPLVLSHYRSKERRVIPATSLKGPIRSIVEAVSRSCIRTANWKVNKEKGRDTPYKGSLPACRVRRGEKADQAKLCPACGIFGAMGFEGKVRFRDASQAAGECLIMCRPAPNQPNKTNDGRHSTHRDKYYGPAEDGNWHVKGRKFYYHFGQPENQSVRFEPVEVCASGSRFTFQLDFENLLEPELGLLLVALGQGDDGVKVFKLGGSKPFGYGAVEVSQCDGKVWDGQGWRKRCLEWDEDAVALLDWGSLRDSALSKSRNYLLSGPILRLREILDQQATMREHSPGDLARWRRGEDQYE